MCPQRTTDFARRDETRQRLTEQERQERNQQLQKTLTLLVHACSCHDPQCSSTSCRKVRRLFKKSCFAPGVLAAYLTSQLLAQRFRAVNHLLSAGKTRNVSACSLCRCGSCSSTPLVASRRSLVAAACARRCGACSTCTPRAVPQPTAQCHGAGGLCMLASLRWLQQSGFPGDAAHTGLIPAAQHASPWCLRFRLSRCHVRVPAGSFVHC